MRAGRWWEPHHVWGTETCKDFRFNLQLVAHYLSSFHAFLFRIALLKNNLFIYFWLCLGLPCCTRAFSSCSKRGCPLLQCSEFLLWWFLSLWCMGSRHTGFSSCSTEASLLHCMWDLPGPGIEPLSPELAGGFLTTRPPGKPSALQF